MSYKKEVVLTLIGVLRTPHQTLEDMPIQPCGAAEVEGTIELFPEYAEGLADLDGFSHATLLYHLHKSSGSRMKVKPFMDDAEHGVFATRAPCRPAAIGMSTVRIQSVDIEAGTVTFTGADMLNDTPLIDIKPFFGPFDNHPDAVSGWLESKGRLAETKRSDDRFC